MKVIKDNWTGLYLSQYTASPDSCVFEDYNNALEFTVQQATNVLTTLNDSTRYEAVDYVGGRPPKR